MRKKCRGCLCRTCLKSCNCRKCNEKVKECKKHREFRQLRIFEPKPRRKYERAPRYSWDYYGITKERYRKLKEYIQSGKYNSISSKVARKANKDIAKYILLSVSENLSYDELQKLWDLRKIDRMPCGRSDFYGYRRYFYSILDKELRRIGK